jgi:hypothetical protein
VYFSNDFETLECTTPVTRTELLQNPQASSTTKVTCDLPPRGTGSVWYTMTMYVDSLKVPSVMSLAFIDKKTPKFLKVLPPPTDSTYNSSSKFFSVESPRYYKTNDIVSFYAKLFTQQYGMANSKDAPLDTDTATVELISVFVGKQQCEMVHNFYICLHGVRK